MILSQERKLFSKGIVASSSRKKVELFNRSSAVDRAVGFLLLIVYYGSSQARLLAIK